MELKKLSVESLIKKLTDNPAFINEFLDELTVNVTKCFAIQVLENHARRNYSSHHATRGNLKYGMLAVPQRKVLSMCIMLKEMGILQDVTMIATDLDVNILERAKSGVYPVKTWS
jgi:chemotaxis protein methyltransferase CheR